LNQAETQRLYEYQYQFDAAGNRIRALWIPAVNNHGAFGRWAFIEIDDPWNAKNQIYSLQMR